MTDTTGTTRETRATIDCRVAGRVPDHLTTEDTHAEVTAAYGSREISDAAAVTIASWWASPGTEGRAMAALATTGRVDVTALLDDIHIARRQAAGPYNACLALDMLATWASNHPSRSDRCPRCGDHRRIVVGRAPNDSAMGRPTPYSGVFCKRCGHRLTSGPYVSR